MKRHAKKTCDLCGVTVAEKYFLRYVTVNEFVTIRTDKEVQYPDDIGVTQKEKRHFCRRCWNRITYEAKKFIRAVDKHGHV